MSELAIPGERRTLEFSYGRTMQNGADEEALEF